MIYIADMAIDAIQSAKTTWLQTFIKEDSVRKSMQDFVDAQTKFTKQIAKSYFEVSGAAAKAVVDKVFTKEVK
jgi:hypothetical protein